MDVLIVGAGVGGLALAGALGADGHRVRLLEAAPALREDGAAVTIFSNGAAALAGLGAPLPDPTAPNGFGARLDRLEFRSPDDRPMFRADLRVLPRRTGFPVTSVPRRRLIAGYAGPVAALLAEITDAELGCFPHALHDVPDAWGTGAVTLLGDAAHAFPPSQAQGANQALEDAWTLRRALSTAAPRLPSAGDVGATSPARSEVEAVLRDYERERARRVRRVSRRAATESTNRPPNAATRLATRLLPASATGRTYLALLRRFSTVLNAGG